MMRLSASRSEIVVPQQHDLDAHVHDNDDLAGLVDRIAARIGSGRVLVYLPVESHIPERAMQAVPAQHHLAAAMQAAWPAREDEPPLRPLRLFERPEAIDVGLVEAPDHPPKQFTWRRVSHRIAHVEGPERVAMEWWRTQEASPTRDYFRVEDDAGQRFWLFRDGLYGEVAEPKWFMHGLFA